MFNFISRFCWLFTGKYLEPLELISTERFEYNGEDGNRYYFVRLKIELPGNPNFYIFKEGNKITFTFRKSDWLGLPKTFYRYITLDFDYMMHDFDYDYIDGIVNIYIPDNNVTSFEDFLTYGRGYSKHEE